MTDKRRKVFLVCSFLALSAPAFAAPINGGTLHLALQDDLRSLDPALGYDIPTMGAERLLFNGLLTYDSQGTMKGDLATGWKVEQGGKRYRFSLRRGVRFHDGRNMTSKDVRYSIERLLLPETKSPGAAFYSDIRGAQDLLSGKRTSLSGLSTPDPHTLVIDLEAPNAAFLSILALPFTSVIPAGKLDSGRHPIGTGPFRLASWVPGQRILWERNKDYFKPGRPHLDRVEYLLGLTEQVESMKFERGEIDIMGINRPLAATDYLRFRADPTRKDQIYSAPDPSLHYIGLNTEVKPFDKLAVRRAVAHAIDKRKILRLVNGRAQIAQGVLPPSIRGAAFDKGYSFDPPKAKQLLKEAGFPKGFKTSYWCSSNPVTLKVAESVQQDLRSVGIELTLKPLAFPTLLTGVGRRKNAAIFSGNWTSDYPDPSNFLASLFHSRGIREINAVNTTFFSSKKVDALLDRAARTVESRERNKLYRQAERGVLEQSPIVPLYFPLNVDIRAPRVQGYFIHPIWPIEWETIWLKP